MPDKEISYCESRASIIGSALSVTYALGSTKAGTAKSIRMALSDLRHLCDKQGLDFSLLDIDAWRVYNHEKGR